MAEKTTIPWCDSTFNLIMGCRGCELWTKKVKVCYAGKLTEKYAGEKGWPDSFDIPKVFPERMTELKKWSDLRLVERVDKYWMPARFPRLVFLNDMGDTFTDGLPYDWMEPFIDEMKSLPFVFLLLTKRVTRMIKFFEKVGSVPRNFVVGTSVTDQRTAKRVELLPYIPAEFRFLSVEPLLEDVTLDLFGIDWVIVGGESGERPFQDAWARNIRDQCDEAGASFFMKQKGGKKDRRERVTDFPPDLRIRNFPAFDKLVGNEQMKLW